MNIIKNIIFSLCILISFQSISYAMEIAKVDKNSQLHILSLLPSSDSYSYKRLKPPEPKNLSEAELAAIGLLGTFIYYKKLNTELVNIVETTFKDGGFEKKDLNKIKILLERGAGNKKSHKVEKFLDSSGPTDIDLDTKTAIIAYFNKTGVGTPVCIKNSPEIYIHKIIKFFESLFSKSPYPPELKVDKKATAIALELRKNTKINPEIYIPILKNTDNSAPEAHNTKYPYITMHSVLSKQLPNTIPFCLAHEFAHIEMGNVARNNLVLTSICLIAFNYLLPLLPRILANKEYDNFLLCCGCIGNIPLIAISGGYFKRKEEKACDLRAVEILGSDAGVEELFSHEPKISVFAHKDLTIKEIKFKPQKPQVYTTWKDILFAAHPSPAERVRYCKEYAEQLKNPGKYFLGYRIRK